MLRIIECEVNKAEGFHYSKKGSKLKEKNIYCRLTATYILKPSVRKTKFMYPNDSFIFHCN